MKFDFTVSLREFDSDDTKNVKLTFDWSKKEPKEENEDGDYDDEDIDFCSDDWWLKYFEGPSNEVSDWLQVNMSPEECIMFLYKSIAGGLYEQPEGEEESEKFKDHPPWNGQIVDELQRLTVKFLNDEDRWAEEIGIIARRIIAKMKVISWLKVSVDNVLLHFFLTSRSISAL
jgi:hypothetical protein